MTTKWFGSYEEGLVFKIEAVYDEESNKTNFKVTVLKGSLDLNAVYWGNGDTTGGQSELVGDWQQQTTKKGTVVADIAEDGTMTFAGSDNALNMNGVDEVWDGGIKLSNAGLAGDDKETFSDNWENGCYTFSVAGDLTDFLDSLGVRGTTTSTEEGGEGSIKWVGGDEEPQPPEEVEDHFPEWPQDISNVVLYYDTGGLGDSKHGQDGIYTVKIDNWPSPNTNTTDLDNYIDDINQWVIDNDPIVDENSELLGAHIQGGSLQGPTYFDLDNDLTDVDEAPTGDGDGVAEESDLALNKEIDVSYNYDVVFS